MPNSVIVLRQPEWTERDAHPEYYSGILTKRIIAYAVDATIILALMMLSWGFVFVLGFLTLGLAWHLLILPGVVIPLFYHAVLISGPRSATLGMRLMGIRVMSIDPLASVQGGRPTAIQAIIQTVAFYGSVAMTGSIILVVALFNERRRTLHDWLAGTVTVNEVGHAARHSA